MFAHSRVLGDGLFHPCAHGHEKYVFLQFGDSGNNSLFISMCILRDLPQQKNPGALCPGSTPNFICSHVPGEILLFLMKRERSEEIKRVLLMESGCSSTHAFS
jgi:hypothetical protein